MQPYGFSEGLTLETSALKTPYGGNNFPYQIKLPHLTDW